MRRDIEKVVVIGANGAMGAGAGEVFAAAHIPTTLLARTVDKAEQGRVRAQQMAKSDAIGTYLAVGSYDEDLESAVADADLIFEAVAENMALKREFFERIDRCRKPDSIVATVSSGLSIAEMCEGRSESFCKNFLGLHLFNPPNVIVGCEIVPHAGTDSELTRYATELFESRLGRVMVQTTDTPAFAGNRVGFKVLNEVAQLAEEHGVAFMDQLIGPHTGRAMAPLTTIDFVGWDVHKAIVDNLKQNSSDWANDAFALPEYMAELIQKGHLGNKTADKGGFFRREGRGRDAVVHYLNASDGSYSPLAQTAGDLPQVVVEMKQLHRIGRYREALELFATAKGDAADLMRRVVLGYVSYALSLVGDVVEAPRDVDRIMGFGFNWAPPSVLVDLVGAPTTIKLLEQYRLPVAGVLAQAADQKQRMFSEPNVDIGRFFFG